MTSKLVLRQSLDLPFHPEGDFDHGDVYLSNEDVFIFQSCARCLHVFLVTRKRRISR